jgi:hypothetical protein
LTPEPAVARKQAGRTRASWVAALLALLALGTLWLWMKPPAWLPGGVSAWLPEAAEPNPPLYRWRDDRGRVHVTDRPPTDGRPYETLRYHPDTNVVPSLDGRPRD